MAWCVVQSFNFVQPTNTKVIVAKVSSLCKWTNPWIFWISTNMQTYDATFRWLLRCQEMQLKLLQARRWIQKFEVDWGDVDCVHFFSANCQLAKWYWYNYCKKDQIWKIRELQHQKTQLIPLQQHNSVKRFFSTVFSTKTRSSDLFLSLVHVDVLYNRRLIFWLQLGQSVNQPWTGRLIDSNCKSIVAGSIFLHWTLPLLFAVSLY